MRKPAKYNKIAPNVFLKGTNLSFLSLNFIHRGDCHMGKLLSTSYTFIADNLAIVSVVMVTLISFCLSILLRLSDPPFVMEYCDACKYLVEGGGYASSIMRPDTDGSLLKLVYDVVSELLSYNFGTWDISQNGVLITVFSILCFIFALFLSMFNEHSLLRFTTAVVCFISFSLNISFHFDAYNKREQFKTVLQKVIKQHSINVQTSGEDKDQRIDFKDSVREIHKLFDNTPSKSNCMTLVEMQVVLNKQWCSQDNIRYCFKWIYSDEHPQKINYSVLQNEAEKYIFKKG